MSFTDGRVAEDMAHDRWDIFINILGEMKRMEYQIAALVEFRPHDYAHTLLLIPR
jgi:hypothetical protein